MGTMAMLCQPKHSSFLQAGLGLLLGSCVISFRPWLEHSLGPKVCHGPG